MSNLLSELIAITWQAKPFLRELAGSLELDTDGVVMVTLTVTKLVRSMVVCFVLSTISLLSVLVGGRRWVVDLCVKLYESSY